LLNLPESRAKAAFKSISRTFFRSKIKAFRPQNPFKKNRYAEKIILVYNVQLHDWRMICLDALSMSSLMNFLPAISFGVGLLQALHSKSLNRMMRVFCNWPVL